MIMHDMMEITGDNNNNDINNNITFLILLLGTVNNYNDQLIIKIQFLWLY